MHNIFTHNILRLLSDSVSYKINIYNYIYNIDLKRLFQLKNKLLTNLFKANIA